MIAVALDYATPSFADTSAEAATLGLTANARRPVRFHARVVDHKLVFRYALQTLGECVWSNETWLDADSYWASVLDPVITVHPDRVFFEAFSQDQSVYGVVIADRALFEPEGEVTTGTTNVDFTRTLWQALSSFRSSRDTWLRVGPEGFRVETTGTASHFEAKVDIPDDWVRAFLQLQGAMAMPGTRLTVRPTDLLGAVRFEAKHKARISPRALRYELEPGRDARLVLEPWEETVELRGASHNYTEPRVIRTWGRKRLRLIERLLCYAEAVDIYLKGRALPSFYAVKLPGVTFVLGLSGWTGQRWAETASFDLLSDDEGDGVEASLQLDAALGELARHYHLSEGGLAESLTIDRPRAARLLTTLCRRGRAIFDVERRHYRHRELFEQPIDVAALYPRDERKELARTLLAQGKVNLENVAVEEQTKKRRVQTPGGFETRETIYRDRRARGKVDGHAVEIVINHSGRVIFGRCECSFFQENLMNQGPCAHMVALFRLAKEDSGTTTNTRDSTV